jgi:hypothetical protein
VPLPFATLDDRTYADLVQEGLALVSATGRDWTNHNASDPGITLLELFAFVTETLVYRINRVTERERQAFARLLGATAPGGTPADVEDALRALRAPARLVTASEFEAAALAVDPRIKRAHCVSRLDLTARTRTARQVERPGYISVAIVAHAAVRQRAELVAAVAREFENRRLLTVRVRVVEARPVRIGVRVRVVPRHGVSAAVLRGQVRRALESFLDHLVGGADGQGWPFGGAVYTSEIYRLLDDQPGVDYVTHQVDPVSGAPRDVIAAIDATERERRNADGELIALNLDSDELVSLVFDEASIAIGVGGDGPASGGRR